MPTMFMSVLKDDTTQVVNLVLLISNLYMYYQNCSGKEYILKKNTYLIEITWLHISKKKLY